jgi:hypothetical protein
MIVAFKLSSDSQTYYPVKVKKVKAGCFVRFFYLTYECTTLKALKSDNLTNILQRFRCTFAGFIGSHFHNLAQIFVVLINIVYPLAYRSKIIKQYPRRAASSYRHNGFRNYYISL